jgi:hypothetical protein
MGMGDQLAVAYPASSLIRDYDYNYGDVTPGSYVDKTNPLTRLAIDLKFSRFVVKNRRLVVRVDQFNIWTAATGAAAPYAPTAGSEFQLYWLPHFTSYVPTDAEIIAQGYRVPTTRPYDIDLSQVTVPPGYYNLLQPDSFVYDGTLSITFFWGNTNYYRDIDITKTTNYFKIMKVDQDIAI